ncbi:MAG: hypothetical protein AAF085_07800, partial [Planctomycetota bacterium]
MKDTLLTVLSIIVVAGLCLIALWWSLLQGLNGEVIVHPTEAQERKLSNQGKLIIEITPVEEAMWGGDSYSELKYFYQPPDIDRREFVGRGRGWDAVLTHTLGDRVCVTHCNTLYLRSSDGA